MCEDRCPRCESPDPKRHPAMQFEGEVQICTHPFHPPVVDLDTEAVDPAKYLYRDVENKARIRFLEQALDDAVEAQNIDRLKIEELTATLLTTGEHLRDVCEDRDGYKASLASKEVWASDLNDDFDALYFWSARKIEKLRKKNKKLKKLLWSATHDDPSPAPHRASSLPF